jgi:hypothetical protein
VKSETRKGEERGADLAHLSADLPGPLSHAGDCGIPAIKLIKIYAHKFL